MFTAPPSPPHDPVKIITITMDSEDFEDLFGEEATLLEPSSQGSLTEAAANVAIDHEDDTRQPCNPVGKDDEMEDDGATAYDLLPVNTGSFADTVRQNDFRPPQRLTPRAYPKYACRKIGEGSALILPQCRND